MAITLPPVPKPIDPSVSRVDAKGKPTTEQVTYEQKVQRFMEAVKAAVEGL